MIQSAPHYSIRRGISTVLGVLLMLGILFTTIVPLFIYMNTVDNYYDTTVVNMGIADQERSMEDLTAYAFGRDESNNIHVKLVNIGSITVNISRIWVTSMDLQRTNVFTSQNVSAALNLHDLPLQLNPSNQATIENLTLTIIVENPDQPELDVFHIEVTTTRGNVFPSGTNPFNYNGGTWSTGMTWPWLEIIICSDEGQDDFEVDIVGDSNNFTDTIYSWNVLGDFFTIIPVIKTGAYNVTVTKTTQKMHPKPLYSQQGNLLEILIVTEVFPISMVIFIDPD
ncbi:MAG: hypothetical protein V3V81_04625 [Candidatus Bathyarchaeia archaeon]